MESFYLLIPMTIIFCALATGLFLWAVRRHQFDDLESAGRQILFDDDPPAGPADPSADSNLDTNPDTGTDPDRAPAAGAVDKQ